MIWCSFACEVLGMAATYIMQFLRVNQLSACLEAPSWWTNDDCYASEASKNPIFIQKRFLASSLLLPLLFYRFVVRKRSPSIITRFTAVGEMDHVTPKSLGVATPPVKPQPLIPFHSRCKYNVAKGLQELITLYGVTLHLLCLCFNSCLLCCYIHLLINIYKCFPMLLLILVWAYAIADDVPITVWQYDDTYEVLLINVTIFPWLGYFAFFWVHHMSMPMMLQNDMFFLDTGGAFFGNMDGVSSIEPQPLCRVNS